MGLKVIDGTPTAISKFIGEQEQKEKLEKSVKNILKDSKKDFAKWPDKEKRLPDLQTEEMKCVFCGTSNQKESGGYFLKKFLCINCTRQLNHLDYLLGWEKNETNKR